MSLRFYSCEVIVYTSVESVLPYISKMTQIHHYACITHDKDVNADGTLKKLHSHFYLTLWQNMSYKSVANMFSIIPKDICIVLPENVARIEGSLSDCFLYLTHKNTPEKYQYDDNLIICDCPSVFTNSTSVDNVGFMIVCDLIEGVSYFSMAKKYGRDFIINLHRYLDFVELLRQHKEI